MLRHSLPPEVSLQYASRGYLGAGRSPPLSPGDHRPTSHNLFGSTVRASAQKESKRHGCLLCQCGFNTKQKASGNAWNCTVIIACHCQTLALEASCASLQARRQIICNKSLSCAIGGLKSIFTSLQRVSLEDLCA